MAELNTASLRDFVKNATVIWVREADSLPEAMRNSGIYKVDSWDSGTGDTREYSEIDVEEYAHNKSESAPGDVALVQQGYTKTVSPKRRGLEISISWEMRRRNKYRETVDKLTSLARHVPNRRELDLTHRFTFGTATTYADMDGQTINISTGDTLQLFYATHTLAGSSTQYRNRLANNPQLSNGALEAMEKLIVEQTYNQLGQKKVMSFDILWTTDDPNTVNTARELLQSTAEISAPNSGVKNVYMGKYKHVILPRLATTAVGAPDSTKAKYWGIASSSASSAFLAIEEDNVLTAPTPNSNGEDFSTDDWRFKCRGSYGIVIVGAAWVKMSSGDGVA